MRSERDGTGSPLDAAVHETPQSPDRDRATSFGRALDEVLLAFSAESNVRREELLARHPELGDEVDAVIELAREIAVVRPQVLPSIPGYEILGEVGRGGMGVVYRARQRGVDRVVALKVLPEAFGVDAHGRTRFLAEARGLGRIRHDHVVTIHEVVETSDVVAYAMEWVDGRSLASLLEELAGWSRRGEVPVVRFGGEGSAQLPNPAVPWFCRLGIALGRALGEVHRHGLVHRDVKPGNVLLRSDGTPLLSDFGLVRAEQLGLTRTGQVVGTPAFAAPEQLRGDGERVGPLSDVFALGATLHCALAGQVPFAGRTPMELLTYIEARRRRSLTELRLPRDLETIVGRCVEPEARDRYASADAVADDLENLLALRPVQARPLGAMARGWRLVRRNRPLVLAGVVSGLVVLGACALLALWIWNRLTLPGRFEQKLLAARTALLEPTHEERVELAGMGKGPGRSSVFEMTGSKALKAYDDVLRLDGSRIDAVLERDVVALALQMLRREAPTPSAALRAMAPQACTAAVGWHAGSEFATREIDGASNTDRRALGLFAFLTGRTNLCHEAWGPLELAGDPFVDAAAGQMHLQRGEIAKAYARLSRAAHVWDKAGFLAVAFADCAVREGDLPVAERELDRADTLGLKDPFDTHVRVKADLRAAQGRIQEARELYELVIARHFADTARLHYIAMLERVGGLGRAMDLRLDRFERGSDKDAEEVVKTAWRWWSSLALAGRIAEFSILFSESPTGSRLCRLAVLYYAGKLGSPDSRTAARVPASDELHGATTCLAFLMELTQMNLGRRTTSQQLPVPIHRALVQAIGLASGLASNRRLNHPLVARFTATGCHLLAVWLAASLGLPAASQGTVQWTNATPTGVNPPGRDSHMTALDPSNREVLIYGGISRPSNTFLSDFWRWNGGNWMQSSSLTGPGPLAFSSMVNVESAGVVLMFGGWNGVADSNQTWLWNGANWTNATPPSSASNPSARHAHGLAYDSVRNVVVMYGGLIGSSTTLADTWVWDPTTHLWSLVQTISPPGARCFHGMCFDCLSGTTIVHGGTIVPPNTFYSDTWAWNGFAWASVGVPGIARRDFAMAWDEAKQWTVLFGGQGVAGTLGDVLVWNGTTWSSPTMSTSLAVPGPRQLTPMIFDRTHQCMVLFGGHLGASIPSPNDTWTYTPQPPPSVDDTGPGCPNPATNLTPHLSRVCGTGPWVGGNLTLQVDDLPPGFPSSVSYSWLMIGFSNPNLPLGGIGAPACTLLATPDLWIGPLGIPGTWLWNIPPNPPSGPPYYGFQIYAQSITLDVLLPVGSPGWIRAMSNGLKLTLGSR